MFGLDINKIIMDLYATILGNIEYYLPKIFGALIIILIGFIISYGIYKFVIFLFKKFKIIELIDKLNIDILDKDKNEKQETNEDSQKQVIKKKISDKIKIDIVTAKAISYYIFLVFFRLSIVMIGIKDIEDFLGELLRYLPNLFIGVVIGFFGIRFANFIYDVVFHTLNLGKHKTAKIIASGAKIIILFFTLMFVLNKIGIANDITNTILIGFISMLSLAGGLAFGLGGKDIAKEIFESFRK